MTLVEDIEIIHSKKKAYPAACTSHTNSTQHEKDIGSIDAKPSESYTASRKADTTAQPLAVTKDDICHGCCRRLPRIIESSSKQSGAWRIRSRPGNPNARDAAAGSAPRPDHSLILTGEREFGLLRIILS
ncbi:uncharacterized protein APUU_60375S [Aspergillus puulaauensis]|uniref:Uncharacterized protein n=1 Tax=Aspergillus puulaauensis TaxID=1220207 RepID=A0A7R8AQR8_9EURO|nr:uncharacterized protein APUU_60375S [Aspergillus puulaauensis]BCS27327.1 hypothetical protein APUU_60375S [Aspergillus puulaauensis]